MTQSKTNEPLSQLWLDAKKSNPSRILFVKIGRFIHLFNEDVDIVNETGLLLDKHIIDLRSESNNPQRVDAVDKTFYKIWAIPETILPEFFVELDKHDLSGNSYHSGILSRNNSHLFT
tara:strand:- start:1781 stop:2134 length:354 start_codon:yes stop_codon:yes gene_type:complete